MLTQFLTSFEPVHIAQTDAEKEAVYRLRYQVYVEELNKSFLKTVDHQKKWIKDPEDDSPDAMILYTGSPENLTGTLRIDIWRPGKIPETARKRFSLHLMPFVDDITICEAGRLIISKKSRGHFILPALTRMSYKISCQEDIKYSFVYCAPGLVNAYRKLGFRPFASDLIFNPDGVRIPMVSIVSDVDYYKSVGSPVADLAKKYFKSSKSYDLELIKDLVGDDSNFQIDEKEIWKEIQERFYQAPEADKDNQPQFIARLPEDIQKYLTTKGFIVDVPKEKKLVRENLVEEEMFVILDGVFEVKKNEKRIAILQKGDIFGEMAFFLDTKKRTADVYSATDGKVLILRKRFLTELIEKKPQMANQILMAICQNLTKRLAGYS